MKALNEAWPLKGFDNFLTALKTFKTQIELHHYLTALKNFNIETRTPSLLMTF